MASLKDIPPEYLHVFAKQLFIAWIKDLKVDHQVKRILISYWIQYTRGLFDHVDYRNCGI